MWCTLEYWLGYRFNSNLFEIGGFSKYLSDGNDFNRNESWF